MSKAQKVAHYENDPSKLIWVEVLLQRDFGPYRAFLLQRHDGLHALEFTVRKYPGLVQPIAEQGRLSTVSTRPGEGGMSDGGRINQIHVYPPMKTLVMPNSLQAHLLDKLRHEFPG